MLISQRTPLMARVVRELPNVPGERILRALHFYHCLTAKQVQRLHRYAQLRYAQTQCQRLVQQGYVEAKVLPRATRAGSSPSVHYLTWEGFTYLAARGYARPKRFNIGELRRVGPWHLY